MLELFHHCRADILSTRHNRVMVLDPATGRELSENAIQRVLFVTNDVHVYQIPPLTSNRGFSASTWTSPTQPTARQIFTARLRVIETSLDSKISVVIALEDGGTGDLFAAAPYTTPLVVQQAQDSSRFFAVRVQAEGGMKATLGIGFEDRSPAFDFGIALNEAKKVLGIETTPQQAQSASKMLESKDLSLKDGESIQIQFGGKGRRQKQETSSKQSDGAALFSIAPPPAASTDVRSSGQSAKELGFDDGEFGEFQ